MAKLQKVKRVNNFYRGQQREQQQFVAIICTEKAVITQSLSPKTGSHQISAAAAEIVAKGGKI
jgi:hypothetical protein